MVEKLAALARRLTFLRARDDAPPPAPAPAPVAAFAGDPDAVFLPFTEEYARQLDRDFADWREHDWWVAIHRTPVKLAATPGAAALALAEDPALAFSNGWVTIHGHPVYIGNGAGGSGGGGGGASKPKGGGGAAANVTPHPAGAPAPGQMSPPHAAQYTTAYNAYNSAVARHANLVKAGAPSGRIATAHGAVLANAAALHHLQQGHAANNTAVPNMTPAFQQRLAGHLAQHQAIAPNHPVHSAAPSPHAPAALGGGQAHPASATPAAPAAPAASAPAHPVSPLPAPGANVASLAARAGIPASSPAHQTALAQHTQAYNAYTTATARQANLAKAGAPAAAQAAQGAKVAQAAHNLQAHRAAMQAQGHATPTMTPAMASKVAGHAAQHTPPASAPAAPAAPAHVATPAPAHSAPAAPAHAPAAAATPAPAHPPAAPAATPAAPHVPSPALPSASPIRVAAASVPNLAKRTNVAPASASHQLTLAQHTSAYNAYNSALARHAALVKAGAPAAAQAAQAAKVHQAAANLQTHRAFMQNLGHQTPALTSAMQAKVAGHAAQHAGGTPAATPAPAHPAAPAHAAPPAAPPAAPANPIGPATRAMQQHATLLNAHTDSVNKANIAAVAYGTNSPQHLAALQVQNAAAAGLQAHRQAMGASAPAIGTARVAQIAQHAAVHNAQQNVAAGAGRTAAPTPGATGFAHSSQSSIAAGATVAAQHHADLLAEHQRTGNALQATMQVHGITSPEFMAASLHHAQIGAALAAHGEAMAAAGHAVPSMSTATAARIHTQRQSLGAQTSSDAHLQAAAETKALIARAQDATDKYHSADGLAATPGHQTAANKIAAHVADYQRLQAQEALTGHLQPLARANAIGSPQIVAAAHQQVQAQLASHPAAPGNLTTTTRAYNDAEFARRIANTADANVRTGQATRAQADAADFRALQAEHALATHVGDTAAATRLQAQIAGHVANPANAPKPAAPAAPSGPTPAQVAAARGALQAAQAHPVHQATANPISPAHPTTQGQADAQHAALLAAHERAVADVAKSAPGSIEHAAHERIAAATAQALVAHRTQATANNLTNPARSATVGQYRTGYYDPNHRTMNENDRLATYTQHAQETNRLLGEHEAAKAAHAAQPTPHTDLARLQSEHALATHLGDTTRASTLAAQIGAHPANPANAPAAPHVPTAAQVQAAAGAQKALAAVQAKQATARAASDAAAAGVTPLHQVMPAPHNAPLYSAQELATHTQGGNYYAAQRANRALAAEGHYQAALAAHQANPSAQTQKDLLVADANRIASHRHLAQELNDSARHQGLDAALQAHPGSYYGSKTLGTLDKAHNAAAIADATKARLAGGQASQREADVAQYKSLAAQRAYAKAVGDTAAEAALTQALKNHPGAPAAQKALDNAQFAHDAAQRGLLPTPKGFPGAVPGVQVRTDPQTGHQYAVGTTLDHTAPSLQHVAANQHGPDPHNPALRWIDPNSTGGSASDPWKKANGDPALKAIFKDQGFHGKPLVVSQADLDARIRDGATPFARAVSGQRHYDDITTGDYHFGGTGYYGNGTYVAYGPNRTSTVRSGYSSSGGVIFQGALHKDAKVGDYNTLMAEMRRESARASGNVKTVVYSDVGRYAAMKGYDAINLRGASNHTSNYMVILNRSMMIISHQIART